MPPSHVSSHGIAVVHTQRLARITPTLQPSYLAGCLLQGMKEKMRELAKNLGIPNPGALNM